MNKYQFRKTIFLGIPTIGLLASIAQNFSQLTGKHHFLVYLIVYLYGLHVSYAYIFDKVMYEDGVKTESRNENQPILRSFYGVSGFVIIAMCYWGIWVWSNT